MKIFFYILLLCFYSCAVQGPISGGPIDLSSPELIRVIPENFSTSISKSQDITLVFNEPIDPSVVYQAITIDKNIFKIKVRGKNIVISPDKEWSSSSLINIYIDRTLQDYQKNKIANPIDLYYSLSNSIPLNSINGSIIDVYDIINKTQSSNYTSTQYEVALYEVSENSRKLIKKVQSDSNLEFNFKAIESGTYTLAAVESRLSDINKDLYTKKYSTLNRNIILDNDSNAVVKLNISKPITKKFVSSVIFHNPYYISYLLSDESLYNDIIKKIINNPNDYSNDSISISLKLDNQFYSYHTPEFKFIIPDIIDTLPPSVISADIDTLFGLIEILFSEPVKVISKDSLLYYLTDDSRVPLEFISDSFSNREPQENKIKQRYLFFRYIDDIDISDIHIDNKRISDYYNNILRDSLLILNHPNMNDVNPIQYGRMLGSVEGLVDNNYTVIAYNIETFEEFKVFIDKKYNFIFKDLPSGSYLIQAYESYDNNTPKPYYAGEWNLSKSSKFFSKLIGPIEVRGNWDIENIVIKFE